MKTKLIEGQDYVQKINSEGQNYIELAPHILQSMKFKKVTGSRLGSIQGVNEYCSPFVEWCKMVGLVEEVIKEDTFTNAGTIIEHKVTEKINEEILKDVFKAQIKLELPNELHNEVDNNHPLGLTENQINALTTKFTERLKTIATENNFNFEDIDLSFKNAIFADVDEFVKDPNKKESYFNFFLNEGDFGGIPDGIIPLKDKQGNLLLNKYGMPIHDPRCPLCEIKTVSKDAFFFNFDKNFNTITLQKELDGTPILKNDGKDVKISKWYKNGKPSEIHENQLQMEIPPSYLSQMKLYANLAGVSNVFLAHTFLNAKDYTNPDKYNKKTHEVFFKLIKLNVDEVKNELVSAQQWYNDFIKTGISPPMMVKHFQNDQKWFSQAQDAQTKIELENEYHELLEKNPNLKNEELIIFDLNRNSIYSLKEKMAILKEKINIKPKSNFKI